MSEQFDDCEEICRICLSNGLNEELLSPCECRGSVSHIHSKCLIDWISVSKTDNCNICRTQYNCVEMTRTLGSVMGFLISVYKRLKREVTLKDLVTALTISTIALVSLMIFLYYILFPSYHLGVKMLCSFFIFLVVMLAMLTHRLAPYYRNWRIRNSVVHIRAKPKTKN